MTIQNRGRAQQPPRTSAGECYAPLKDHAAVIRQAGGRAGSLGIILCVVNQAVNADKLGGSTTLRTNVIQ
ncbi:hypothetical protein, partial [Streptomyces sp. NPDC005969]|uniref:hypothetical protein n=1 Tax=Streptomyces sp. NPDC005969 TaxID=3156722 RepID=UPI0033ECF3B0